jgi:hypothetical protein
MATIRISDLQSFKFELFSNSESLLNDLVNDELENINGGLGEIVIPTQPGAPGVRVGVAFVPFCPPSPQPASISLP